MTDYQHERMKHTIWAKKHYIDEFGLSGRLLDAGCHDGFWSSIFDEYGIECVCIDRDPVAITRGADQYPFLKFRCVDIMHATTLMLGSFDWVFARTLPFYYAEYLSPAIGITRKLLSLGDHLLLSFWTMQSGRRERDGFWHYTEPTLRNVVDAAGGKIVKTVTVGKFLQIEAQCYT